MFVSGTPSVGHNKVNQPGALTALLMHHSCTTKTSDSSLKAVTRTFLQQSNKFFVITHYIKKNIYCSLDKACQYFISKYNLITLYAVTDREQCPVNIHCSRIVNSPFKRNRIILKWILQRKPGSYVPINRPFV